MKCASFGLTLICFAVFFDTNAQKLPNVQQTSIRAPANLKIDGKPTEWDKFAAYNNATSLLYTMANDDKNLYLALQASDPNVLTKITNQGVRLVINPSGQKDDKDAVTIQYPVYELQYSNKPYIQFSNVGNMVSPQQRAANAANPDSMLLVMNKRLHGNDKFIRTSGMAGVDTLLSIYNEKDVVAKQGFEKGPVYTYELSIPLKYLKLVSGSSQKFSYHVILNGLNVDKDLGLKMRPTPDGRMALSMAPGALTAQSKDMRAVTSKTDFWGEYTLAK